MLGKRACDRERTCSFGKGRGENPGLSQVQDDPPTRVLRAVGNEHRLLLLCLLSVRADKPVKTFKIQVCGLKRIAIIGSQQLNDAPETRWNEVIDFHREFLPLVAQEAK